MLETQESWEPRRPAQLSHWGVREGFLEEGTSGLRYEG